FLNDLGEATRTLSDPKQIMVATTRLLGRHLRVSRCAYADVQEDSEHFNMQVDYTDGCATVTGRYQLSLFGPRAVADMHGGRTLVIRDLDTELAMDAGAEMFNAIGIKAIVCCPLIKEGALRAMMAVHQNVPREWSPEEIALVQEVVERCWSTIERARAEAEVRERARLSALRADIAARLAFGETIERTLQGCCALLVAEIDAAAARVWLFQSRESVLELQAGAGLPDALPSRIALGDHPIGSIAERRQPCMSNDLPHGTQIDPALVESEKLQAFAGYPLVMEGRLLGVFAVFARHPFSEAALADMASIADGFAQCIERKHAEAALNAGENLKSAILNTSLDGFILMNHEGIIMDWNSAAEGIFGVARTEAIGRLLGDTIVPERLRERHQRGLQHYVATRQARILGRRYELPALRADGSEFPCEISITHIPGVEPPLFAGYLRDISGRKQVEDELRAASVQAKAAAHAVAEAAGRFKLLAEVISLQVWTARLDGALDFANQEYVEYSGAASEQELLGQAWTRFVHPDDLPGALALWEASLGTGERCEVECRLRNGDDAFRWFLVRAEAMRDHESRIAKWFGTNTDIHALKIAQSDAERASRAKDAFLASLSHELRTPLTPVLMTAAALRDDDRLPVEVREQLGMMERNIGLEARLIDDLLDLTRIARGKLHLRLQACDAHSLVRLAVGIVSEEARTKGMSLECEFYARRSTISVDPARFQQVIWNLLRNAVKFTPSGGRVAIRSRDQTDAQGAHRLCIEVIDSGIGIDPATLGEIFLPFEQGGLTGDHRFGGIGLGLAIARAIVELHGGVISAQSGGRNHGATFLIELPGATETAEGAADRGNGFGLAIPALPSLDSKPSLRLLLVEDHEPTLEVLTRLLHRAGHHVVSVNSVGEALKAAAAHAFDLVVSDLGLPDGTGTELMAQLRDTYGLTGVALSGYGMEEDILRSRQAGFGIHLTKPVDFHQLRQAIHALAAG
ncbi:MAG: PAS domain S-box protein, partial [Verrucomicrobiota bacterium]